MSDITSQAKKVFRRFRTSLGLVGTVMLIAGLLILIWPTKTASFIAALFGIYMVIAGLVYVGTGFSARSKGGWARVGHVVLGVLYVIAGVIMLSNLGLAAVALAAFVGILVGITWIVDGVIALTLLGRDASAVWTVLYALLSIVAGVVLLLTPVWAATALFLVLGVMLVVLGIVQIVRAITITHEARAFTQRVRESVRE